MTGEQEVEQLAQAIVYEWQQNGTTGVGLLEMAREAARVAWDWHHQLEEPNTM